MNEDMSATEAWDPAAHAAPVVTAEALPQSRVLTVETCDGGCLEVCSGKGETMAARQAVSCLVTPVAGDRVLTTFADGHHYVLAVLDRPQADAPVSIETLGDLVLSARRISIKAGVFDLVAEAATLVGHVFNSLFRTSKRVAGTDETIAQSTTVSAHERVSIIAGSDVHKAGVFSQTIESAMAQSAHTAVVTAKTDIRLNAERINVG
ncbi:DUF3540 domain-containing protein [Roseibium sediminicola]|uniref:DUF3540 domain-containing protein n=1 Tax=Roseibium sediminicola TaxID=2933272 RepID=A0ABT0GX28_9HYPH|nr:DUF3540 domain-containing protein [Roseibium sp. CAU 1639]MCK7614003.1 DUF3540 domain-containing protein [Roseibium sp. CAU 1639]